MEIDTIYENVGHESKDTRGRNNKDGKEQRGRVCLVWMTVSLGLICVLLLVFIIWMNIIITAEREEHETTVQEFNHTINRLQTNYTDLRTERDQLQKNFDDLNQKKLECERNVTSCGLFFLSTEAKSWSGIRQFCRDRGGDLVTIKTEEKQRLISSLFKEKMWIGLTVNHSKGTMKWVDDSPLKKGFWTEGEPNNYKGRNEECVELDPAKDAANNWNDLACTDQRKGICEK